MEIILIVKEKLKNILNKKWSLPLEGKLSRVISSFSLAEKTVFTFFTVLLSITGLILLFQVNKLFLVEVPDYGGTLTEGVIGTPRFINPLLATSDIDKDLTTLVYSGLLKVNVYGGLTNDLAESYTISDDGLTYTFTLRDNIYFQDGIRVTSDDVVFTVEKAQEAALKSPREASFAGVKVERIDDKNVSFTLKQAFSPFIQNLTLGILPRHIWKDVSNEEFAFSQFNTKPIGAGPYGIDSITYSGSGLPSEYHLKAFKKYSLGEAYITQLVIKSYQNEKEEISAYKDGDIDSLHSISPKDLPQIKLSDDEVVLSPLPRIFGVFFNQNVAPVLVYKEVRSALETATDKDAIVKSVLGGYGTSIDSPIPVKQVSGNISSTTSEERVAKAQLILTKAGWKQNSSGIFEKKDKTSTVTLSFSISTGNATELKEAAYLLQQQWQKIGAIVEVKIFEIGDLNQNIIKPRKYDALLFGEIVGRDNDLYPFWHSSGRTTPGLNIALYTNLKADKALENIRATVDPSEQKTYFDTLNKEIKNDIPAVFTYSPYFIYIVPKTVKNVSLGTLTEPKDRWANVNEWYIETNNVWQIFNRNK